jgi:virginiamycin B lyase
MTEGPDGNLWFTGSGEEAGGEMGRLTAAGVLTIVALPTANDPNAITSGPDGNLWFTVAFHGDSGTGVDSIGKITPDLAMTLYPLSAALITSSGIVAGPDGALWFTEAHTNAIGRITTSGEISGFPFPGRPTTAAA